MPNPKITIANDGDGCQALYLDSRLIEVTDSGPISAEHIMDYLEIPYSFERFDLTKLDNNDNEIPCRLDPTFFVQSPY